MSSTAEPRPPVARLGLLAVALLLGLVLVLSTLSSYRHARSLASSLARGQGQALLAALRPPQGERLAPPSAETLEVVLKSQHAAGLRYAALTDEDGRAIVSVGSSSFRGRLPEPGGIQFEGKHARLVAPPPPRLPGPPPGLDRARPPGFPGPPPRMVIEFESTLASDLADRALRNLILGSLAAFVLVSSALVFWRLAARADRTARALAEQRHLASLGEMSAVLAHEIKNPLAALKGHAQLLAEKLPVGERARERAGTVVEHAVRLEHLTRELLDFARSGELHREQVCPSTLAREARDLLDPNSIQLSLDEAPLSWSLDSGRFRQVLINLLENALQASPTDQGPELRVTEEHGQLVITVSDHGPGFEGDDTARLFAPFHTTRTRGTGLGLAVAARIVQLHGGEISARDNPGGGAQFRISVPG